MIIQGRVESKLESMVADIFTGRNQETNYELVKRVREDLKHGTHQ